MMSPDTNRQDEIDHDSQAAESDLQRMLLAAAPTAALAALLRETVMSAAPADAPEAARRAVLAIGDADVLDALSGIHPFPAPASLQVNGSRARSTAGWELPPEDALSAALYALAQAHEHRFGFLLVIASVGMDTVDVVRMAADRLAVRDRADALTAAHEALADIVAGRLRRALAA